MSDKPLNKREKTFLIPAIVYGWEIEITPWLKEGRWDGDPLLSVRVGTMVESLIERGYLKKILPSDVHIWTIRATEKAMAYKCRTCYGHYRLYNDEGEETGKCPDCENGVTTKAVQHE